MNYETMTHEEQMAAWVKLLKSLPKTLVDFGWNLEHVAEPRDEQKENR